MFRKTFTVCPNFQKILSKDLLRCFKICTQTAKTQIYIDEDWSTSKKNLSQINAV